MKQESFKLDLGGAIVQKNPCVKLFGAGPVGMTCKHCRHLSRWKYARTYMKCEFRTKTHGPATDHLAGWQACAKYEAETPR
jgi:hypothetical protein